MNRRFRRLRAGAVILSVAAVSAACGSGQKKAAPVTAPPTLPTTTTATTTPPPATTAPLTGLPDGDIAQIHSPAVVVKIDNIDAARPQTGLDHADVVYEEEVEGGLTRLAAVFQSDYPTLVGPVRSGRLTDEGIADDLNHPVYVFSGTNANFLPILDSQPLTPVNGDNQPSQFERIGDNAPHNIYISVASVAKLSTTHTAPSPLFSYNATGQSFTGSGVVAASGVTINFPSAVASWKYNPATSKWLRSQNGSADVLVDHQQISATNVVILFVDYISSGVATGEGVAPTVIPEGIQTGGGEALFFSQGREVKGTWSRSSLTSVATYSDADGRPISLTAGNTWIELAPQGASTTVVP